MNFTPYIQAVKQYLAKDIIIDGHALPVKYIAGAAGTILGLTAINTYANGAINTSKTSMDGKFVIITGANDGIGKETAIDLAKQRATVIIACRESEKTKQALAEIRSISNNTNVFHEPIDLSDLDSVKAFATRYTESGRPIHVLINNAGIMALPNRRESKQGYELQFATNHLGHYLLTELLLPVIKKSAPARIINVASKAMYRGYMNFDDINYEKNYNAWSVYSQSKLANVLYSGYLQRQLKGSGVLVNSLHPGVVRTGLTRYMSQETWYIKPLILTFYPLIHIVTKSAVQGAQTTLYLATSDAISDSNSGEFWSDCKILRGKNKFQHDVAVEDKLNELSKKLVANWL
ncbi:Retinol dehydrogenase 13 [Umbelopsis nana]